MSVFYPPEDDDGNVEYKLQLIDIPSVRITNLATQMRYRVNQGDGEATYIIGLKNDGTPIGLNEEEEDISIDILQKIASEISMVITLINRVVLPDNRVVLEFLVREKVNSGYIELRVAIGGSVDAGKSSLLGTLIGGELDDGRGKARLRVFNFPHEIKSGRTSSISQHILGFDNQGNIVNYKHKQWKDIVTNSSKIYTFYDLAGHEGYLKTTISGMTSSYPHFVLIAINANVQTLTKMTKEHILLAVAMKIPIIIVITKVDLCTNNNTTTNTLSKREGVLKETSDNIKKLLKHSIIGKVPYDIRDTSDVMMFRHRDKIEISTPIFYVSNLTGQGLDLLKMFFNFYHPKNQILSIAEAKVEHQIDHIWDVPGIGTVVGGILTSGTVSVGARLLIGPYSTGEWKEVIVKSIRSKKIPLDTIKACTYACFGLRKAEKQFIKKGMVLISPTQDLPSIWEFYADIFVQYTHSTTTRVGYEPVVHGANVRQVARILSISKINDDNTISDEAIEHLRSGDKARVHLKFCHRPAYVRVGYQIFLCEGRVKISGKIVEIVK
jgi:GTPase